MNPVYRFIKESVASNEDILLAASKYYDNNDPDDPKHRWDHMLDVMDVAKKIRGRDLDPDEFGMIAFHDSGYKHPKGYAYAKSRHPMFGAKIFRKEGPGLGYSPEEVKHIAKVIAYHNHKPDYASSPLLKDDMQMLLFSADEGTPIDLKDDAKMYYVKGRNGVYKGVDPKSKDFIKQLVAKVKTFGNYSKLKRLKYYNDVYPGYLQSKYDFWQSPDLEKYYKELDKKDKKKEDKYTIHGAILGCLGDNAKKFKYNITEDLPDDPWGAIIHTKPMTMDKVRQFHSYHNIDVDGAGVPYYFLTKNERTGDKYVWYSDDAEPIRINTKEEKELAKNVGLEKGLVPDQLDFKFTEKKASKLYTYVPKNNTVDVDGLLSTSLTEDGWKKYSKRTGKETKEEVLKALDEWEPEWSRSRAISALAQPIPDDAAEDLKRFADESELYSFDVDDLIKAKLLKNLRKTHKGPGTYSVDSISEDRINWKRKPKKLTFYGIPHYMVETTEGKIPAKFIKKQAGKLYTYVDPEADLSKGLLSARLAPEDALMRRYPNSGAKNKKELIGLMQNSFKDDKDRPSLIYALSSPIPDTANSRLLRFRANHKLVSYETDKIKDLVKLLKRRYRKPPIEVKDVEPRKYIQWGRKPKDGAGAFFYAPVYKVLTESGKIDPELLTIES